MAALGTAHVDGIVVQEYDVDAAGRGAAGSMQPLRRYVILAPDIVAPYVCRAAQVDLEGKETPTTSSILNASP